MNFDKLVAVSTPETNRSLNQYQPEFWSEEVLDQAVAWHVELSADQENPELHKAWYQWYSSCSQNQDAWNKLAAFDQRMSRLSPAGKQAVYHAELKGQQRRALLKGFFAAAVMLPGATWLYRENRRSISAFVTGFTADYVAESGEQRVITLTDGSQMHLNTASRVNVLFDGQRRVIELVHGEIFIKTAKDRRPLSVVTEQGEIQALGTEFQVRLSADETHVALFSGQVALMPKGLEPLLSRQHQTEDKSGVTLLQPGQGTHFDRRSVHGVHPVDRKQLAWQQGMLIVQDWPLDRFCQELSRYLPGKVYCREAASGLRISGSFPLQQPDQLVQSLPHVLPVQVQSIGGFVWILDKA